jgi:hypothetical protein
VELIDGVPYYKNPRFYFRGNRLGIDRIWILQSRSSDVSNSTSQLGRTRSKISLPQLGRLS